MKPVMKKAGGPPNSPLICANRKNDGWPETFA
jgi:hypothetical protein